jgi:hypothetical protein
MSHAVPDRSRKVPVAFNFISERSILRDIFVTERAEMPFHKFFLRMKQPVTAFWNFFSWDRYN